MAMDSGRPRDCVPGARPGGGGLEADAAEDATAASGSNMDTRLTTEPDLCRRTLPSSASSWCEGVGDAALPCSDLVLSTTDGALDVSRFCTAKKVDDGRSRLTGRDWSPDVAESFSSALMRCEMLDPTLGFMVARLADCCCVTLCKKAAPELRERAVD